VTVEQLTIAIDYDDTFTACPDIWRDVIELFQDTGHRVICVSSRRNTIEHRFKLIEALPSGVEIFLVYDQPKRDYVKEKNVPVDIWIDDNPESIIAGR